MQCFWPCRRVVAIAALVTLTGCGGGSYQTVSWDGRRGYDGSGDYGYDSSAVQEAASYQTQSGRGYTVPGTPDDPWGPYVREASSRFGVPDAWIRAVMRQESGGHQFGPDGLPITSSAGAMGLMQVMPGTYDLMRQRFRLGPDPFEPRNNILAGTAYMKIMYDRFGAPAFLAAYNAGPERVDAYLGGSKILPTETVNYVASIGPRIGMAGSFASSADGFATEMAAATNNDPADAAYAGGGMTGEEYNAVRRW